MKPNLARIAVAEAVVALAEIAEALAEIVAVAVAIAAATAVAAIANRGGNQSARRLSRRSLLIRDRTTRLEDVV
jgi:hypothetical protein